MSRRIYLTAGVAIVLALVLSACGLAQVSTPLSSPNTAAATQQDEPLPTVEIVNRVRPSVVQIVSQNVSTDIFNQPVPRQGVGSGVIMDNQGNILTNNHVVEGAESLNVTLTDGRSFPATIVGTDPPTDLAVINIQAQNLNAAEIGSTQQLQIGEDAVAIGHAFALSGGPTVSKGVISALGRSINIDPQTTITDLIQTDAQINPGNSGGPLVNSQAQVIGINTAAIPSAEGIGFAINIDDARQVVQQLLQQGFVNRGFLGISPVNLSAGLADRLGLPVSEGVLVSRVISGMPAAQVGMSRGDVIVQLAGQPVPNTGVLSDLLMQHPPGQTVSITYLSDGDRVTREVTLAERPNQS